MALMISESEMKGLLSPLLFEGEKLDAAVYCLYKPTGFWGGRQMLTGYVGITDRDRMIERKEGMLGGGTFAYDLKELRKIGISRTLFGQYSVHLIFLTGKKEEIKFQAASHIHGANLPDQEQNLARLLERLREKEAMLAG